MVLVSHGPRSARVVALTFDDGWSPQRCLAIGQQLLAADVPATFFINGKYIREAPGVYRWLAGHGFTFGNHTFSHTDQTILSEHGVEADLDNARRVLESVIGVPSLPVFRPPFGRTNATVLSAAGAVGYRYALTWDVDSRDWAAGSSVASVVRSATAGTNGSVVLMHCGSALTPLALQGIIGSYRARGFGFVSVGQLLALRPTDAHVWTPDSLAVDPWPAASLPLDCPCWRPSLAVEAGGSLHVAYKTSRGSNTRRTAPGGG